jgi:phospholipid transport system transporter-binding protein
MSGVLVLPATVTVREARDTLRMLRQALRRDGTDSVVVDAAPLRDFDSSALAVLLACRRLAQDWGKAFTVQSPPAQLVSLAGLYGVDVLLNLRSAGVAEHDDRTPVTA